MVILNRSPAPIVWQFEKEVRSQHSNKQAITLIRIFIGLVLSRSFERFSISNTRETKSIVLAGCANSSRGGVFITLSFNSMRFADTHLPSTTLFKCRLKRVRERIQEESNTRGPDSFISIFFFIHSLVVFFGWVYNGRVSQCSCWRFGERPADCLYTNSGDYLIFV